MAVVPMKRMELWALRDRQKPLLELLQLRGAVEVRPASQAEGMFSREDTSQLCREAEQAAQTLETAAQLLEPYAPGKKGMLSFLAGRPVKTPDQYASMAQKAPALLEQGKALEQLGRQLEEAEGQFPRLAAQKEGLAPWVSLDLPLTYTGTEHTRALIGSFPEAWDTQALVEKLEEALPEACAIELQVLSRMPQMTCVFLLCHVCWASQVEAVLRGMGFSYPPSSGDLSPALALEKLEQEEAALRQKVQSIQGELQDQAGQREDLLLAADYYQARAENYRVLGEIWQSPHAFCVTGYVPEDRAAALGAELENRFAAFVRWENPAPEEDTPVQLRNGLFTAPMENVVEGYSLPTRQEVDPSAVMAVFYYVFYGLMLSDAAYGLLMVAGCGIALKKFKHMEERMGKSLRMFLFCGISTTLWGVLFGSYFGDCIPVIAETFFHQEVTVPALWFEPLSDPMRLLIFSFGVGVLHLFTGLGVQFYQLAKRRKYADALYDVVFWYLLVGGLLVVLLSTEIFQNIAQLPFRIPSAVVTVAGVLAGVGAVGILCTAGRESKNPFKRFLKGLYGLYNVSGYLSDILSYSRLLALSLATGVISTVFNQLGAMLGDGVVGALFFAVVFLIGHSMNMAINVLGAYVHTNRLQFVEFFGKFYEGGGKAYAPFAVNTRHFQIKEEK